MPEHTSLPGPTREPTTPAGGHGAKWEAAGSTLTLHLQVARTDRAVKLRGRAARDTLSIGDYRRSYQAEPVLRELRPSVAVRRGIEPFGTPEASAATGGVSVAFGFAECTASADTTRLGAAKVARKRRPSGRQLNHVPRRHRRPPVCSGGGNRVAPGVDHARESNSRGHRGM